MLMRSTVVVTCSTAPQRRQSAHPAPEAVPGVAEQHHRPAVSLPAAGQQRRALLAAAVGVVVQQCSGSRPAAANVLDDFSLSRRKTNARFLAGTVELARERLIAAQALPTEQAIPAVNKAALDCLEIEAPNLRAYSKYREVCTFRIVARSVTDGPAARYTEDSPIAEETVKSLLAVTKYALRCAMLLANCATSWD